MKYKSLSKLGLGNKKQIKNKLLSFLNKTMICTIILLISLIVLKHNPNLKSMINEKVFNDNFSFAYIKEVYNKYFGNILPVTDPNTVSVFEEKLKYTTKVEYYDGYKLGVETNYLVPVIETGIIVFIGEKENYGKVIIVEQIDGYNVWYGNINSSYKLYDYVTKGSFLGEVIDKELYLLVEKNGEYTDIENILS